jgi:hypothetical protein
MDTPYKGFLIGQSLHTRKFYCHIILDGKDIYLDEFGDLDHSAWNGWFKTVEIAQMTIDQFYAKIKDTNTFKGPPKLPSYSYGTHQDASV